jgi:UDP-N-acetyl-D-mannosaminuronate dehydrogenase
VGKTGFAWPGIHGLHAWLALDCAIIVTDHDGYDFARITRFTSLLVDTRNATAGIAPGNCRIVKA